MTSTKPDSSRKTALYKTLLKRQSDAHATGYYFEASWFAHAIFEDRTSSIVANSGDGKGFGGKISEKLELILDRLKKKKAKVVAGKPVRVRGKKVKVPKWPRLQTLDRSLIEQVRCWTQDRNDLTHKLASGSMTVDECDRKSEELSSRALELTRLLCASARRVKRYRTP